MLRLFFKKRITTLQRENTIMFYSRTLNAFRKTFFESYLFFNSNFHITLPKRQQYFTFFKLNTSKTTNFSAGRYLLTMGYKSKFFKRQPKNALTIILQLKRNFQNLLRLIYMFSLRNFNHRQFTFFKKFNVIVKPEIKYLIHKRSFIPRFLPKRRIRRRVLRIINKK